MTKQTERHCVPDFDRPPIVETALGVQFDHLRGFNNAHLGAFWKLVGSAEWPVTQDAPLIAPQFERFGKAARWSAQGIQLQLAQVPSCRLQLKNATGDRMIQVQNNRLHFNWLGEAGSPYPRYEVVRDGFLDILAKFVDFIDQERVGEFRPNQWEVTYVNHIPKQTVWNTPNDWSFFRLFSDFSGLDNVVSLESFGGEWHFAIPNQNGRLHIKWNHGSKPEAGSDETEIVELTFTARGPIDGASGEIRAIEDRINIGRQIIVSSFVSLMSKSANDYWGLK